MASRTSTIVLDPGAVLSGNAIPEFGTQARFINEIALEGAKKPPCTDATALSNQRPKQDEFKAFKLAPDATEQICEYWVESNRQRYPSREPSGSFTLVGLDNPCI